MNHAVAIEALSRAILNCKNANDRDALRVVLARLQREQAEAKVA